jgi:GNAT superfamily N-acetyltransferase
VVRGSAASTLTLAYGHAIIVAVGDEVTFKNHRERPIDPAQVRRLYETVPWGDGRDDAGIAKTLEVNVAVGAWDGDELIGFTRAMSDGLYRAYVEDVMIDPDYRGNKIGERMVAKLLEELGEIEIVSLFCEPERVAFYQRNGFSPSKTQVMMHRRAQDDVP